MKTENFKRLPKGIEIVKQNSYAGQKQCGGMYAVFLKNGNIIDTACGNSKTYARKYALKELNRQLLRIKQIWGNNEQAKIEQLNFLK
jgi:hypothetical protein